MAINDCSHGGEKYEGDFKNDLKHGKGKLILSEIEQYDGCFSNDLKHGPGVYINEKMKKNQTWNNNLLIQ